MAKKSNIRSIRFSDELAEMIDRQVGDTFTQKFENLITRCVWELPQKEKELEQIEKQIQIKRADLTKMHQEVRNLSAAINDLAPKVKMLESAIDRQIAFWNK